MNTGEGLCEERTHRSPSISARMTGWAGLGWAGVLWGSRWHSGAAVRTTPLGEVI